MRGVEVSWRGSARDKKEPEINDEPEIKQEPFTIQSYSVLISES